MRCKNCGAELNENAKFCLNCGASVDENYESANENTNESANESKSENKSENTNENKNKENLCPNCHKPVRPDSKFCLNCGAKLSESEDNSAKEDGGDGEFNHNSENGGYNMPPPIVNLYGTNENVLPMKWYNFLVKFMLFFVSVANAFTGVMTLVQTFSTGFQEDVPVQLVPLYIANGVFCIIMGGYALYVRASLAGFRKKGPVMFYAMYGAGLVFNLIYSIVAMILVRELFNLVMVVNTVQGIVVPIVVIILNKMYFDKRKHLFIN